ncbi:MAG: T9SS type A sorting domain-containing protein, partial [Bacteroidales bacterium]|nr:T9SS type A sorting domain-containing protein [Bacteroidales bacterium]
VNTHNWSTSEAIDSALSNNVKVHLCVTLFSGHSTFFNSSLAQQTLITNLITLVESRGAHGVNMDVEALPSAYGDEYTDFMIGLCDQMHTALPGSEVSIAAPAVNWSGTFNIPMLNEHIDFFMVMGYDYYWNGSSQAGAVSPLYSMVGNYDYNFSKTISYYQSQGVPNEKLVMGVPYYAREWETEGQFAPSNTTGSGEAHTYSYIQNNSSGNYSPENKHWEPNSFSPYFSFQSNGWKQCFVEDTYSLRKKYDIINRRKLGGIGIWALGYDNGYSELWELIAQKFTEESGFVLSDTIFDTGGPAFNYYNYETYTYTISSPEEKTIGLTFNYLDLEPVYDSLWIFDGPDVSYSQLGAYSGNSNPGTINSTSNYLTLKFFSDLGITNPGWEAIYEVVPLSQISENPYEKNLTDFCVYPNPFKDELNISFLLANPANVELSVCNISGSLIFKKRYNGFLSGQNIISFDKQLLSSLTFSTYLIYLKINEEIIEGRVVVKD